MVDDPNRRPRKLRLEGVVIERKGRCLLGSLDLVVEAGVPLAVTGPSGSGKTVLCLVLAGALAPTHGRMSLDGRPFVVGAEASIGLVLQTHGLMAGLTAEENVAIPLQARRLGPTEISRRTTIALESVGLVSEASRPVDDLSGGERQRVGVARALAGRPLVLVADEPTAELDPGNRQRVLSLLAEHAVLGNFVVVASDDPEVVDAFPQKVELSDGRILERSGSANDVGERRSVAGGPPTEAR
jgi:putative ABC transport system ATP-binding protein